MNSYISSSDPHRRYVLWLFSLVLVPVCALYALGVYLEPLWGDLTRIGFYSEREFGWNGTQWEFNEPLSTLDTYDRYHEVVVLGDSFSTGTPRVVWQNYLVATTGWSVVTLNINKVTLDEVLATRAFRETPPKLFVLESAERDLPKRVAHAEPCRSAEPFPRGPGTSPSRPALSIGQPRQIEELAKPYRRSAALSDVTLTYARGYLRNVVLRRLFGEAYADAVKVGFSRPAPFSSANNNATLVYKSDFRKVQWWRDAGVSEIGCRFEAIKSRIEENGVTRFVLMVAPDKLTAYADYLMDDELRKASALSELAARHPQMIPRLDVALAAAIGRKEPDVYLPDDTHWGHVGYRIASETLLEFLGLR